MGVMKKGAGGGCDTDQGQNAQPPRPRRREDHRGRPEGQKTRAGGWERSKGGASSLPQSGLEFWKGFSRSQESIQFAFPGRTVTVTPSAGQVGWTPREVLLTFPV